MDMNEVISMFEPFFVGLIVLLAAGLPAQAKASAGPVKGRGRG